MEKQCRNQLYKAALFTGPYTERKDYKAFVVGSWSATEEAMYKYLSVGRSRGISPIHSV
jgi:hypothetical protein